MNKNNTHNKLYKYHPKKCSLKRIAQISIAVLLVFLLMQGCYNTNSTAFAASNKQSSTDTCKEICDEGIVLLKNSNNALPTANKKLNIFGLGGSDNGWYYQGNGSGAGCTANRVSLYQSFRESGFQINEKLANDYNNCGLSNHVPVTEDPAINYVLRETDPNFVTERVSQAKDFSDQALVVFSRYGGEGNDLPKFQCKRIGSSTADTYDTTRHYCKLTTEEEQILQSVENNFSKVYVLFNCCNPMEMDFLNSDKIQAALYMPMGGNAGAYCVPDAMSGDINPSGRLTDTIATDFTKAPTYANISYEADPNDVTQSFANRYNTKRFADHQNEYIHYACYEENIYEGYYYYETATTEGVIDYSKEVQYPFGYGLSYTNFDWQISSVTPASGSNLMADSKVKFNVCVTNKGSVSGKDVVELYVQKPYTKYGIEKPSVQLAAFAKTDVIAPGASANVVLEVALKDIADYDVYDLNNNKHMGYELDAGSYTFSLRTDSHNIKANASSPLTLNYNIVSTINFQTGSEEASNPNCSNLFTNFTKTYADGTSLVSKNNDKHPDGGVCRSIEGVDLNNSGIGANYVTRANLSKIPTKYLAQPNLGVDYEQTYKVLSPWIDASIDASDIKPQDQSVTATLKDVAGLDINDPAWDKVMNALSYQEMADIVVKGGFQTLAIDRIGKKLAIDKDGPCGFAGPINGATATASNFPSDSMVGSTWNYQMAYKFGTALGYEGINKLGGIDGCYGPGLDLHRSPFGGRNFEYYSEDPVLSGLLCSFQLTGAKEQGMYCYVKHIALNDSDMGRNGRYNFATEQAFRQIYAKPFEIIAKGVTVYDSSGNPVSSLKSNAAMGSVDRIGTTRVTGSYNFLNTMLRGEWGFQGSVITDYYQAGNVNDVDEGIRSGCDLMLNGANNCQFDDTSSLTYKYWLRQACKNILYTYVDTKHSAGLL